MIRRLSILTAALLSMPLAARAQAGPEGPPEWPAAPADESAGATEAETPDQDREAAPSPEPVPEAPASQPASSADAPVPQHPAPPASDAGAEAGAAAGAQAATPEAGVATASTGGAPDATAPAPPAPAAGGQPVRDTAAPREAGEVSNPFAVGWNFDTFWPQDRSADFFNREKFTTRGGLSLAYDVWSSDAPVLAIEAGWGTERTENGSLLGDTAQSSLRAHSGYLSVILRYRLLSFLEPHARVSGGASHHRLALAGGLEPAFEQKALSPFGGLGAGFTVRTPDGALETRTGRLASLSFGVLFEGGYLLTGPVDVGPDAPEDTGRIALERPGLGELSRSGPYLRTSLIARF